MIITLYGSDAYRRRKKLNELIAQFIEKRTHLALEVVHGEEDGALERAEAFWGTSSLFQDAKLLVIKQTLDTADNARFKKFLKKVSSSSVSDTEATLVLSLDTKQITKEFSFLKEKPNRTQEFSYLLGSKFTTFVQGEATLRNTTIEKDALEYLAGAFAGDSWGAIQELEKLALLKPMPISLAVLKNCGVQVEGDFFSYISGWFRKPVPGRLLNLEKLLASKNDPAKVFNVLAYQDSNMLRRFADYDVEIKSGRLEYDEALLELAII